MHRIIAISIALSLAGCARTTKPQVAAQDQATTVASLEAAYIDIQRDNSRLKGKNDIWLPPYVGLELAKVTERVRAEPYLLEALDDGQAVYVVTPPVNQLEGVQTKFWLLVRDGVIIEMANSNDRLAPTHFLARPFR